MLRRLRKGLVPSDDAFGWIGILLVLVAAIILDKGSAPHKWHAAIMWTFVAFFGVLVFGRKKRSSWLFWIFWAACLVLHVFVMWLIFGQFLPRLILGTLYVVPIAFIESILLIGIFSRLERKLAPADLSGASRG
jgi:ABC-type Co2+ transport system permease subunit